jgi:hypothetical protein
MREWSLNGWKYKESGWKKLWHNLRFHCVPGGTDKSMKSVLG